MTLRLAIRCGRSNSVYSTVTGSRLPPLTTVAWNRVPTPTGPSVSLIEVIILGL